MSDPIPFESALPPLTIQQVALLLHKSVRSVRTYLSRESDPIPCERGNGRKQTMIPLQGFLDWVVRQRIAEVLHTPEGEILDPRQEKALLDRARRELAELDRRRRESELLDRAEVEEHVGRMVTNARSRLLAVPTRLGAVHGGEVAGAADALVREALEELAAGAT